MLKNKPIDGELGYCCNNQIYNNLYSTSLGEKAGLRL